MTKFTKDIERESVLGVRLYFPCGAKFDTVNSRSDIKHRLHLKICKFCSVKCSKPRDTKKMFVNVDAVTGEEKEVLEGTYNFGYL